jgi:hypothetical protein
MLSSSTHCSQAATTTVQPQQNEMQAVVEELNGAFDGWLSMTHTRK